MTQMNADFSTFATTATKPFWAVATSVSEWNPVPPLAHARGYEEAFPQTAIGIICAHLRNLR